MRGEATTINRNRHIEDARSGDIGHRPALVFLHYFGGSSRTWNEVRRELADDYTCVATDLRGFGESEPPGAASLTVKDYADDAAALIDDLKLERYILIGHSMGGKIALALAARQPRGLESLILIAPSPASAEPIPEAERRRLLKSHGSRAAARETIGKITRRELDPGVFERTVEDNLRSSPEAWTAWLEHGSREDISGQMPNIRLPVLAIVGAADRSITRELLERELVRQIAADVRLQSVPSAGHLLPLEDAKAVAALIRTHCQQT